jgi:signal transduction histidine kinase
MAKFRARARAVDMLGRQQIAGIPTAISELFKNAHDAYAERAVADYFRAENLFVLRDDGVGMTPEDFEQRWLMLGTESKVKAKGLQQPPTKPGLPPRPVLGEKGIGRLAIAAIGPQVLVLTRPIREGELGDLLAAFIHWGVFELTSAELEDIDIPTRHFKGGSLPTKGDIGELIEAVRQNLREVEGPGDAATARRIRKDLKDFEGLPFKDLPRALGAPALEDGPGTHFLITPASPDLPADLQTDSRRKDTSEAAPLMRALLGFNNTMTPGHPDPALKTEFRDHWSRDAWQDVIAESEFFTPDEFKAADHHFAGRFDAYGQFDGEVSVFGSEPKAWTLAWPGAHGTETSCGPFSINIAYVQGAQKHSRLDPDAWTAIISKLDRYSGLYIYRDGIRILPYGNSDFDFLDIEKRRTKSASDYFFSYRRMFGVIELTRTANHELREKAGREGFASNEAYRQFRDMLKAFFYQVAFDFFRPEGTLSEPYYSQREELERLDKARARRSRQVRQRRTTLATELRDFFDRVDREEPQEAAKRVLSNLDTQVGLALKQDDDGRAAAELADAESAARGELGSLQKEFEVRRPRGLGLPKELARDFRSYEIERDRLIAEVFEPYSTKIEEVLMAAAGSQRLTVARRQRFEKGVEIATHDSVEKATAERRRLTRASAAAAERSKSLGRDGLRAVEEVIESVLAEAARTDVSILDDAEFVRIRSELEKKAATVALAQTQALGSVAEQLEQLVWPENGDGPLVTKLDELEALETDLEGFRDRSEQDLELTQLGMAVEVINHEFQNTVKAIRANIQRLGNWANENPGLRGPVRDLRSSFEHLDSYLTLFTPLNRRLYRKKVSIKGAQIDAFLRDVFLQRLENESIELRATKAFLRHKLVQYPSTIYPVFVNLVDNATYWLEAFPGGDKCVSLDVDGDDLLVSDSGPGVASRDREAIFEMSFSRKPGGSGYGLHISRQVLERDGMTLSLDPPTADGGAVFRIGTEKRGG